MNEQNEKLVFWIKWLTIIAAILTVLLVVKSVKAADDILGQPTANTAEAVGWALADLATLDEHNRQYSRYVWIPPWGDENWVDVVNFAVNTAASHVGVIQLGTPIANGWMLRFDLETLTETKSQLEKLRSTWDSLAIIEPYFHVPEFTSGEKKIIIAPHLVQKEALITTKLSLSTGGIYRADWFVAKMLSTIEGGKYYDFLQITREVSEEEKKRGITPQSKWLATYGIFEETTRNLSAEKRAAIANSGVTEKPRGIEVFHGIAGNIGTITHDISDDDLDPLKHPLRNLLDSKDTAREIIVERFNGLHAFVLTNSEGEFQESVPDNIAIDTTIPGAHTKKLNPGISCIRCHASGDGFLPFENDVLKLSQSEFNVFSDIEVEGLTNKQVITRLARMYAGNLDAPDGPIGRKRRDYSSAVYKIVKNNPFIADQESIVKFISDKTGEVFASWRYTIITPERACFELGLVVPPGEGIKALNTLLPFKPERQVTFTEICLKAGVAVNRQDFDHDYADMALAIAVNKGWKPTIKESEQVIKVVPPAKIPVLAPLNLKVLFVIDEPQEILDNSLIKYLDENTIKDENSRSSYFVWNRRIRIEYYPKWLQEIISKREFQQVPWMYAINSTGKIYDGPIPSNSQEIRKVLENLR